jgi:isochorismate hydrolase
MLDNFMQIDTQTSDEYREQKDIMERLRTFAVNKNIHIHLVAHPRKTDKSNPRITIYDVLGSSNLVNKAYNVISIIRVDTLDYEEPEYKRLSKAMLKERYDITQTSSILEVLKTKGTRCGLVGLVYDDITKTFIQQPHITSEIYDKMIRENNIGGNNNCPF